MSSRNEAWLDRHLHSLKSAFTGALLVLGLVGPLEHNGHLELADVLMYRVMAVQQPPHRRDSSDLIAPNLETTRSTPLTLGITRESFEKDFSERSPLDRKKLSALIKPLLDAKPAVLAIDLDLSPLRSATCDERQAQARMDDLLLGGARQGIQIIVLAPFAASDAAFRLEKFEWLKTICASIAGPPETGRIWVASSELIEQSGVLAKFDEKTNTLGVLANRAFEQRKAPYTRLGAPDICADLDHKSDREDAINKAVYLFDFVPPDTHRPGYERELRPIRFDYLTAPATYHISLADFDDTKAATNQAALNKRLEGKLVFLGGLYNSGDWFVTPAGRTAGVEAHAAIASTLQFQDSRLAERMKFAIEFVLGLVFGGALSFGWKKYHAGVLDQDYAQQVGGVALGIVALVASFGLVILVLYTALRLGYWLNGLPMLIGMLVHSLHHVVYDPPPIASSAREPIHTLADVSSMLTVWVVDTLHSARAAVQRAKQSPDGKARVIVKTIQLALMANGLRYLVFH